MKEEPESPKKPNRFKMKMMLQKNKSKFVDMVNTNIVPLMDVTPQKQTSHTLNIRDPSNEKRKSYTKSKTVSRTITETNSREESRSNLTSPRPQKRQLSILKNMLDSRLVTPSNNTDIKLPEITTAIKDGKVVIERNDGLDKGGFMNLV